MASSPPPYKPSSARRHAAYYFADGNLTILVERTLYNVWAATFRQHSSSFAKQFSLAADRETSDASPLRLDNVTTEEFERFLWILYPPALDLEKPQTVDDWLAILKLSTMWNFPSARNLAIQRLAKLRTDPVRQLVMQFQYSVDAQWGYEAFRALCKRREPLSLVEARDVGMEVVIKVSVARERLARTWTKPESIVQEVWNFPMF
ncbi:uncharacterized protein SCHCODRAFT_02630957 [Schizophyllum commune H4-8]|uniref:Expressed protein n=1 Tax=Schizophyllum commune (strain H4-8 / FGSC 9210) TaxID=578458 RepID=D8QA59_SCHCM|nr:uncharacterized protein SCHCODRAFT_02630957 [Schizophyllum commune H4-8]KAI5890135.1 hypothetical protein SCHCODRAFT_02630957 [Schizophyllum commune H4-8]